MIDDEKELVKTKKPHVRVRVPLLIMMERITIKYHSRPLGYEKSIIRDIFCCTMRRPHPERRVHTLELAKNFSTTRQNKSNDRFTSLMIARIYGKSRSSSIVGSRSRPTTRSSSSCARFWTSGKDGMKARNQSMMLAVFQRENRVYHQRHERQKKKTAKQMLTEANPPSVKTAESMHRSSQSNFSFSCETRRVLTRQSGTSSPASIRALTSRIIPP